MKIKLHLLYINVRTTLYSLTLQHKCIVKAKDILHIFYTFKSSWILSNQSGSERNFWAGISQCDGSSCSKLDSKWGGSLFQGDMVAFCLILDLCVRMKFAWSAIWWHVIPISSYALSQGNNKIYPCMCFQILQPSCLIILLKYPCWIVHCQASHFQWLVISKLYPLLCVRCPYPVL